MKRALPTFVTGIALALVSAASANAASVISVDVVGGGRGHVTAPGIHCPPDCLEDMDGQFYDYKDVDLTATAEPGSIFSGWGGACDGVQSTCTIGAFQDKGHAVTARFEQFPIFGTTKLNVSVVGGGAGTVIGPGIACPGDCSQGYLRGAKVTLTADPAVGAGFAGWTGACSGPAPACTLTMSGGRNATATFTAGPAAPGAGPGPSGTGKNAASRCTIAGTVGNDLLVGTRGRDVICGRAGNDRLKGLSGADTLIGGRGADVLRGGRGRDLLYARDNRRDRVIGGAGTDRARVDPGRDMRRSIEARL